MRKESCDSTQLDLTEKKNNLLTENQFGESKGGRQFEVFLAGNRMANRTFREKNKNKVESFYTLFLTSKLTWITYRERARASD